MSTFDLGGELNELADSDLSEEVCVQYLLNSTGHIYIYIYTHIYICSNKHMKTYIGTYIHIYLYVCVYSAWKFPEAKGREDKLVTPGRQKDCLQQRDLNVSAFPCLLLIFIWVQLLLLAGT